MDNRLDKLKWARTGKQVETCDLHDAPIIVGVDPVPKSLYHRGACPCAGCAFGDWKTEKVTMPREYCMTRDIEVYKYDIRCPLFEACNAKDRPDRSSVIFTKIQSL